MTVVQGAVFAGLMLPNLSHKGNRTGLPIESGDDIIAQTRQFIDKLLPAVTALNG